MGTSQKVRCRRHEPLIHESVAAWSARDPRAVALVAGDGETTYGELEARANRLARHLRAVGVERGSMVALMVERSPAMVVALLGVLKAGGAYVPIDPTYPEKRLRFMLEDLERANRRAGRRTVLVSHERLAERAPAETLRVLLDRDRAAIASCPATPPGPPGATAADLAYVIYTSGSTGLPKGVAIAHGGVAGVIRESVRAFGVTAKSRVLQLASLSFDASVLEIFTALTSGATLCLIAGSELLVGAALGHELRRRRITHVAIPPSLLDSVPHGDYPDLESIVVGGEAVSAETTSHWQTGRLFWNAYAPTEATIFTTLERCSGTYREPPPLGHAIAGTEVRLMGAGLRPPGDGEAGEIVIGGGALALGYLNRPALTAERFVPDPAGAAGARLYRSGDLAQPLADGNLRFAGRLDTQVKVRGFRIELGEIEAVLRRHPAVRDAAVVEREDVPGTRWLVAYVVPRAEVEAGQVLDHARGALPDYMVPAAVVFLELLPVTPHGKLDRDALPAPERASGGDAPRTPLERAVAEIWAELLGLERVGIRDDLFQLGGHSLLVAQIVARLRERLDIELRPIEVFTAPTVERLAERLERARTETAAALPPIGRAPRDQPLPLTYPQEQVWFLSQLSPGNLAYNFQFTLRLRGPLDRAALERALTEMVRRHEILRTTFPARGGEPVQEIHPPWEVRLPVESFEALPAGERVAAAEERIGELVRRPFDLERLPLLAWTLLRLSPEDHYYVHVEHHFVHDGWSLAVYLRELLTLYEAFAADRPAALPELPVQFADYAVWQRRWLAGEVLERQLDYWRRRLATPWPPLELPTDRPRPAMLSLRGAALRVDFPPALYAGLRAFCRRQGVTLFMTMLAAFESLLYRYTGQCRFLLGSGVANRRLRESEGLLGMIVNTVLLAADLTAPGHGGPSFRELLGRVRQTTLEVQENQDVPFEKLVQELHPDRDLSRNPLFQVLFSFHDSPVPDLDVGDLHVDLFERHNGSAKSDLNVVVKPRAEQRVGRRDRREDELLTMVWEHSTDLFEVPTIRRMWRHYQRLISAALEDPEQRLAELDLLTPAEIAQLTEWNDTAAPVAATPVHELVAAQAARRAGAPAVAGALTYGELEARANRLARHLGTLGVGPEEVVALLTGRSPEMVVGALGVLKAGGAYLPLDPTYPPERLAFMLDDSGARALLVRGELAGRVPAPRIPVVVLDDGGGEVARQPPAPPAVAVTPHHLAYVIYTSGSTGRPKGVEVSHGGLANLVAWHRRYHAVSAEDRASMVAGPAFDASVWELWPYLAAGASLHVPDAETRADPQRLLAWLDREAVTVSFQPTPLGEALVAAAAESGTPAALRAVLMGGDRLHRAPDPRLSCRVVNHYGPTEGTVVATAGAVPPGAAAAPPIGGPIANTRLESVDRGLRRRPPGAAGELAMAGASLARGYHRRPALTAAAFVPDPWAAAPGGRLYRTGDLARHRATGEIDFLGRIDHQVKVRGFRVELGEIEARLREHPEVAEAVVEAREVAGARALAAYVVPESCRGEELRSFLAATLPDYMVPAFWVPLAALPLTANGKVDRRALPDPEAPASAGAAAAPRTELEELLAGIWGELLGLERVGRGDDFFALGGHSLLATRLLSRLQTVLGVEVKLRELFTAPTLAGLSATIETRLRGETGARREAIRRRAATEPAPLSFAQQRLWFLDRFEPGSALYNVPVYLRLEGALDPGALAGALRGIARRHEVLRTTFAFDGETPWQVIVPEGELPLPLVDLGALPPARRHATARALGRREVRRGFDLERGPVLRAVLLRTAGDAHVLVLNVHHVAFDGWSAGIFLCELTGLYRAAVGAARAVLPELPIQYADFAVWQRRWLAGEELERQLGYWRQKLRGLAVLELPTDRPRPPRRRHRGARVALSFPAPLVRPLADLGRERGATLFMILLAAFQTLLHRVSGQSDFAVGSVIANRDRPEIEDLIGFFVNTLALRADLRGRPSFAEALARVRETALAAYLHHDVPFEKLVEELDPERHLDRSPLVQVLFAFQNEPLEFPDLLPGLAIQREPLDTATAKFDLTLRLFNQDDGGLWGNLEYDVDLFDATTARRWCGHLGTLLAAAADPRRRLAELPLLTPPERHQLLVAWNDTRRAAAPGSPFLHRQVAAQAAARPDRTAVVCGGERLTFGALEAAAGRLAHRLAALGVGPETRVAILLGRSPRAVAAILGVLKAGGAWVPLDPAAPAARVAFQLADAGAVLLITAGGAPPGTPVPVLDLDAAAPAAPPAPPARLDEGQLAYVIYTSGSTGRPKGVMIAHRAVANLRDALEATIYRGAAAGGELRVGLNAPFAFDASVKQLVQLAAGRTLVLVPEEARADPAALLDLAERERLDVLDATPAQAGLLLEAGLAAARRAPRRLVLGGEAIPAAAWEALAAAPHLAADNVYGPTEATVDAAWQPIRAGGPSLGHPLANVRAVVAGRELEPVAAGVGGELVLAGAGLARGYLGRPRATAELFVPDPWSGEPGGRLYRTGDLARRRADGRLEFLGRRDHQVKLRGYRVELGEIEAVLERHPGVARAVAAVRGEVPVAYLVPAAAGAPARSELRGFLAARLPDYMVPAAWAVLDELPLTAHGKVDRRALPALEAGLEAGALAAPRDGVEELLAEIWSQVLGLERLGIHQDFFELGGHSLLATRVMSRLRQALDVELPLQTLFERPTVAALAREVVTRRRQGPAAPPIRPMVDDEPPPLSFAQQRLWFLDRLEPGLALYNIPFRLRLDGRLDRRALAAALAGVTRRHEVLRTTFARAGDTPRQVIAGAAEVPLPVVDLGGVPAALRDAAARAVARREAVRAFDLERGPLLRAVLLRAGEAAHVLFVNVHHVVFDGWSTGVFLRDLAALYRGSAVPELAVSYADFAVWQRRWLAGEELERQLAYWRARLRGLALLDLPTDRPRPPLRSYRGARELRPVPAPLARSLAELGRERGATLFMVLLAAFQTLLHRLSGQSGFAVGSPVANRNRAEIEDLVGFFVNTLALDADFAGRPSFAEVLGRVRAAALGAYTHQDLPFEKLVDELHPERHLNQNPLVQVLFVFHKASAEQRELAPGIAMTAEPVDTGTAKLDLTLSLVDRGDEGLRASLEYDVDLFDATTATRLLAAYRRLLAALPAAADAPAAELPLLGAAERWQLTGEWNDTGAALPETTLHALVAARAAADPDAVAVVDGPRRLSYRELTARAARLAAHLRRLGMAPEELAAVCTDRSAEMVVALLAVLETGGAYVPLDPQYPAERIAFMLADARARVVLTQRRWLGRLGEPRAPVVCLDDEIPAAATAAAADGAGQLAYVIYTSGSTGRPKGVAIEHRSAAALVAWAGRVFGPEELAGVLASTSICFDLSIFELFVPLAHGGTVILADDALALPELADAGAVTLVNTVPSALRELLRLGALPAGVRTINLAGEALPRALVEDAYARPGVERVVNLYGPSEDTTYSTWERVAAGETSPPWIGRPIAGSRAHVVDRSLHRQPIGVPGELCLAGGGLARGYLARPALTAERFVPDPWSAAAGARLYRTGDLAGARADGTLAFLGRLDHQVKIRGFRIELGEIETVLERHPAVAQAVAVARGERPGELLLAAFLTLDPEGGERPDAGALRTWLGRRLPDYMVPGAWGFLDALPLTPSGKVDRAALSREALHAPAHGGFVAPRTAEEQTVAAIWCELLRLERVGLGESFFDLGGHSLLATQLLSRLRDVFAAELSLRRIFERPTVDGLAAAIVAASHAGPGPGAPALEPLPRGAAGLPAVEVPLSFAQQRVWFLEQLTPGNAAYVLATALRLTGSLDRGALARALTAVVRRHEILRTRFPSRDGRARQLVAPPPAPHPLPGVDLRPLPAARRRRELRRLAAAEALRPFDVERGPLLRTTLLELGGGEHVLLVSCHHLVFDGWSLGVLLADLARIYAGGPPLPELPFQYADFAFWEREWLRGEALETQLAWWREHLAGAPPVLELPTDRPRPAAQTYRGAYRRMALEPALAAGVEELARRRGATPFMVLLAGFEALLWRLCRQDDLVVGTPIARRNRTELEALVGFFANTLALRTRLSAPTPFNELVHRVRESTLGASAHQEIPFEKLVDELEIERNLSHSPVFQVVFALQNTPAPPPRLGGLTVEPVEVERRRTQHDLTLTLSSGEGSYRGWLGYNTDLFDATTAERLARAYRRLVAGAVAAPAVPVAELPLLAAAESQQLLHEWNDAGAAYPAGHCLPRLVAAQARRTPDAVAVELAGAALTYGELERRSRRLAHHLRALGAAPEVRVGVLLERSLDMVIALLAVLEAGAAYVPLDPIYPRERLEHMLDDSGARLLVTHGELTRDLGPAARTVHIDRDRDAIGRRPEVPLPAADPESLAYVIYTSGSTGRPKGVEITHRPLVNFLVSMAGRPGLEAGDTMLAVTTICFDIAGLELFLPLLRGARVVVVGREVAADGLRLAAAIEERGASVLQATPATWRMLVEGGWRPRRPLRALCGGEALPADLAAALLERGIELWNVYGPTETTIWSAVRRLDVPPAGIVPVGRPIANTRLQVADHRLRPVPAGVAGELWIGGDGLARGYWQRRALSAERFLPDPFGPRPGGRLYRTGDLVRQHADGDLEILGRLDHQVKLRGFRVELGEIEAALGRHPAIARAVAAVREDVPGHRRLVAYPVAEAGAEAPAPDDLRGFLGASLPDYMVPTAFLFLDELPLTANGKVDRAALGRMALPGAAAAAWVAPSSAAEERLAAIWAEVLGLERVGAHDNFFALGGDSILAIQVVARSRRAGLEIAPRDLFQHQVLARLAAAAREVSAAPAPADPGRPARELVEEEEMADVLSELGVL